VTQTNKQTKNLCLAFAVQSHVSCQLVTLALREGPASSSPALHHAYALHLAVYMPVSSCPELEIQSQFTSIYRCSQDYRLVDTNMVRFCLLIQSWCFFVCFLVFGKSESARSQHPRSADPWGTYSGRVAVVDSNLHVTKWGWC